MTDRITLHGIRVRGHHGVLAHERRDGQVFVVDVELWVDVRPAAATDDLAATVDYAVVARDAAAIVAGEPADLIETVAERVATRCLEHPTVERAAVTVHKPQAPVDVPLDDVAVRVERSRAQ